MSPHCGLYVTRLIGWFFYMHNPRCDASTFEWALREASPSSPTNYRGSFVSAALPASKAKEIGFRRTEEEKKDEKNATEVTIWAWVERHGLSSTDLLRMIY